MNFQHSELTEQVAQTARDFANQYIRPHLMEWDESQEFPLHIFRDHHFLQLDGEIRNATASIDHFVLENCPGGTGFNTPAAGAAIIFGEWIVVFQFQVGDKCSNEKKMNPVVW